MQFHNKSPLKRLTGPNIQGFFLCDTYAEKGLTYAGYIAE